MVAKHAWFMKACLLCPPYFLKAKGQYIFYPWVVVNLASTLWVVLILDHSFYYLLTIVFHLQCDPHLC